MADLLADLLADHLADLLSGLWRLPLPTELDNYPGYDISQVLPLAPRENRLEAWADTTVDLRGGVTLGAVDLQLFVHNLFDERAFLSAATWRGYAQPSISQPRPIGLTASAHF